MRKLFVCFASNLATKFQVPRLEVSTRACDTQNTSRNIGLFHEGQMLLNTPALIASSQNHLIHSSCLRIVVAYRQAGHAIRLIPAEIVAILSPPWRNGMTMSIYSLH